MGYDAMEVYLENIMETHSHISRCNVHGSHDHFSSIENDD